MKGHGLKVNEHIGKMYIHGLLTHRYKCTYCAKCIFRKYLKKSKQKFQVYISALYVCSQSFSKKDVFLARVKRQKKNS